MTTLIERIRRPLCSLLQGGPYTPSHETDIRVRFNKLRSENEKHGEDAPISHREDYVEIEGASHEGAPVASLLRKTSILGMR